MKPVLVGDRVVRIIDTLNTVGTVKRVLATAGVHIRWDDGTTSIERRDHLRFARHAVVFGHSVWC